MTSVAEPPAPAPILWITGLSGSGKSTLAREVVAAIRETGAPVLLLDGDIVRRSLLDDAAATDYSRDGRLRTAKLMARLARMLALQHTTVVVATISLFHEVQHWSREGYAHYAEILLHADASDLRQRYPRFYDAAHPERHGNVVGAELAAEFPIKPDLIIEQRFVAAETTDQVASVLRLWRELGAVASAGKRT